MQIRTMLPSDRDRVLKMMREFYDSPAVLYTSPDEILARDVDDCIGSCPFLEGFVFDHNGAVIGYAMTAFSYTTEYGGLCIWLEDLYILPEFRGLGYASKLFKFIESRYPQAVRFKLEVESENEHAIEVYHANGYRASPYIEMTKEI